MCFCLFAAKLKGILNNPKMAGINDSTRLFLQTKYSTTVIKSRSLHKRLQLVRQAQRMDSLDGPSDDRYGVSMNTIHRLHTPVREEFSYRIQHIPL